MFQWQGFYFLPEQITATGGAATCMCTTHSASAQISALCLGSISHVTQITIPRDCYSAITAPSKSSTSPFATTPCVSSTPDYPSVSEPEELSCSMISSWAVESCPTRCQLVTSSSSWDATCKRRCLEIHPSSAGASPFAIQMRMARWYQEAATMVLMSSTATA